MFNKLKDIAVKRCIDLKSTLTPNRIRLLDIMIETKKPLSAYEIKDYINKNGNNLNISTIYRVLEFWCKTGVIHKISSLINFLLVPIQMKLTYMLLIFVLNVKN